MSNEKIADIPDHLAPLLDPTPSGVAKLVAAWDGLNTESQILILMLLETAVRPAYLNEKTTQRRKKPSNSALKKIPTRWLDIAYLKVVGAYFAAIWETPMPSLPCLTRHD